MVYYLYSQTDWLSTLRDSLWSHRLSSEVQPLTSDTSGPKSQQPFWFRSEAAVFWTGESKLSTADSEVSSCVFYVFIKFKSRAEVLSFLQFTHTHTHTHTYTHSSVHVWSVMKMMEVEAHSQSTVCWWRWQWWWRSVLWLQICMCVRLSCSFVLKVNRCCRTFLFGGWSLSCD